MNEIREQLELLLEMIFDIHGGYTYQPTWNEYLDVFTKSIEIVKDTKNQINVSNDDWYILRKLGEELLKEGIDSPVENIKSYKRTRLYHLTLELKEELFSIPYIPDEKVEIKTANDWIKSLRIYKLGEKGLLTEDYYQTTDDVYCGIRKIVFTKNPPIYKRLYVDRVVKKLNDSENQSTLPQNVYLEKEDYELTEFMRLIQNNPEFDLMLKGWSHNMALILERLNRSEWQNDLKLLIKKGTRY